MLDHAAAAVEEEPPGIDTATLPKLLDPVAFIASQMGLGLREPVISWGLLLTGVQNIRAVALAPWLFLPGVAIVVTVLAFNFVGDGLRDAADPYAQ